MEKLYNYQARSLTKMFSFETEQRVLQDPVQLKKKQKGEGPEMGTHYTAPAGLFREKKEGGK